MPFDLSQRLVVGVASSALFDTSAEHSVFGDQGEESYRAHQRDKLDEPFAPGVAFAFIERLLGLNAVRPDDPPVEVVLLSRNDPDTGRRALSSAAHYGLAITRAAFLSGASPHPYLPAFDSELFLSANEDDVRAAIAEGYPAGLVLPQPLARAPAFAAATPLDDTAAKAAEEKAAEDKAADHKDDDELRIAFDFDGVLVDDATEKIFVAHGIDHFRDHEAKHRASPLNPGPLKAFLDRIAALQTLERDTPGHRARLKTALVTARGAPAHERVVTTLEAWGVRLDTVFFLGGVEKTAVLRTLRPHIFFDDQRVHLDRAAGAAPSVHIPFGVKNV